MAVKRSELVRANTAYHTTRCQVCQHERLAEMEDAYLNRYYSQQEVAEEFGVSSDSFFKHVRYFQLAEKRTEETTNIYKMIAARGIKQMEEGILVKLKQGKGKPDVMARVDVLVDPKTVVKALERLDKLEGREQEPQKNKRDREAIALRIEQLIQNTIRTMLAEGLLIQADTPELQRQEAIRLLKQYEPELLEMIDE